MKRGERNVTRGLWRGRTLLLLGVVGLVGCGGPRMKMLTEKRYPARPASYPIDLYQDSVRTAHEEIALIDSSAVEQLTSATQTAMVESLRARARSVGADAVKDVRMLIRADRGWVPDPQTPFRSWRQGWTDLYFLRGCAVRFKPLLIESGGGVVNGDRFDWHGEERPALQAEAGPQIEVYEVEDRFGRRGFASRRVQPGKRKALKVEAGD